MTAPKAQRQKKGAPTKKKLPGSDRKVSTFRFKGEHRQALEEYTLKLGLLMNPPKQVSKNEALLHMISHSHIILKEIETKPRRHAASAAPTAG